MGAPPAGTPLQEALAPIDARTRVHSYPLFALQTKPGSLNAENDVAFIMHIQSQMPHTPPATR